MLSCQNLRAPEPFLGCSFYCILDYVRGLAYRSQYVLKALQVFVAVEAGEFCVALHVREASRKLAGCCG